MLINLSLDFHKSLKFGYDVTFSSDDKFSSMFLQFESTNNLKLLGEIPFPTRSAASPLPFSNIADSLKNKKSILKAGYDVSL